MSKNLVVGNWKMNGALTDTPLVNAITQKATDIASQLDTVVCVPSVFIQSYAAKSNLAIGAQDCHHLTKGAHTGDISAEMIKQVGANHVVIGHSERRVDHHETNEMVRAKADAAFSADVMPIICVGESHEEYTSGRSKEIIINQIKNSVPVTDKVFAIGYEPIWAIGTGLIPQLDEISQMHTVIRQTLVDLLGEKPASAVKILYGGSVKPNNASDIAQCDHVDGALVGGASLNADDFTAIMQSFA